MFHAVNLKELHRGRHIALVARGDWEFAARNTPRPAVGIVAITDADEVLLVEQFRPPVDRNVIELPAGLAGDIAGAEDESLLAAAQRELLEETGYTAARWTELGQGYSSPGLTDESLVLFLAEDLAKTAAGGGDGGENITLHLVPRGGVLAWLRGRSAAIDMKLLAGLFAADETIRSRR